MFTKTRSALAVVAVAALACLASPVRAQEKLLPNDTEMVMSFNLKGLMASQAFTKHFKELLEKSLRENEQAQKVFSAINMDPMQDLHSLTIAVSSLKVEAGGGAPDAKLFMIAKGKFDMQKIETAMELAAADNKNRATVIRMGNRKVVEVAGNDRTMFGTFADSSTILIADSKERLQDGLDRAEGKSAGGTMNQEFAKVLGRADTRKPVWMAMVMPSSVKDQAQNLPPQAQVLEKITGIVMGLNVTDGLAYDMNIYLTDKDAAQELKDQLDTVKQFAGAATLQVPDADLGAELSKVVDNMKIVQNGNTTSLNLEIGSGTLDKLVKFVKEQRCGGE